MGKPTTADTPIAQVCFEMKQPKKRNYVKDLSAIVSCAGHAGVVGIEVVGPQCGLAITLMEPTAARELAEKLLDAAEQAERGESWTH